MPIAPSAITPGMDQSSQLRWNGPLDDAVSVSGSASGTASGCGAVTDGVGVGEGVGEGVEVVGGLTTVSMVSSRGLNRREGVALRRFARG